MNALIDWTVQCAAADYSANIVTVQASSPEEACARAVEEANVSDGWKRLDDSGPIFVQALAPGEVESPWSGETCGSVLPVPEQYGENGEERVAAREAHAFVERVAAHMRRSDRNAAGGPDTLDPADRLDLLDALIGEAKAIRSRTKLPSASTLDLGAFAAITGAPS